MRLPPLPLMLAVCVLGDFAYAEPVGIQRIVPSSEYERLHDDYAFGPPGPRAAIRGAPTLWIRMDTPADGNTTDGVTTGATSTSKPVSSKAPGAKDLNQASVFFATGSALPLDVGILDFLRQSSDTEVVVTGRADSVGTASHNVVLSKRRAERVAAYLERQGIDSSRIRVIAKGEGEPVASNSSSDGRARNRQVHV